MLALALVGLCLLARPASAQSLAEVAVGGVLPSQPFGAPWTASGGVAARLALPLHGGTADAVLRVLPFDAPPPPDDGAAVPGFLLVGATLGWGPTLRLGPAEATPLARVGAVQFRFDPDVDVPQFAGNESEVEVAVGGALRVAVPLGRVAVWAEGEALRIALADPETLASLSAGVALRLGVPPGVRRLLDE